jgi:dipeptidase E
LIRSGAELDRLLGDEPRRILALGGGGFTSGERSPALDLLALELSGKPVPRICFLPTASGDQREQLIRFQERFGTWPCEPSILPLFRLADERIDPAAHLLSQDVIYAGGGSMRNMLAIWREHGVDRTMRAAWEAGTVLAGVSAGAMCWFEGGISCSGGKPQPVRGLGLLGGSLSVHTDGQPERLPAYLGSVASGELPAGYAADDGSALVFAGRRLVACVASRPGAGVTRVQTCGTDVIQTAMTIKRLDSADDRNVDLHPDRHADQVALAELRALRRQRQRW